MGLLDPIPVLAIMARVTSRIGLGATMSTTFHNPYQIARVLGSLDVLSRGRIAWNVVSSISHLEARNFGTGALPDRDARYDRADQVVEACLKLWRSWEPDALVLDRENGIFADPAKVHRAEYEGKHVRTRGPLTVPASLQGHPVIMQAGASDRGRDFAATHAEMIFTLQHAKAPMQAFYADIKSRMAAKGRPGEHCAILPSVDPIIGETELIAREKQAYINELVHPEVGLALVSTHIGVGLSQYPLDQPISALKIAQGAQGAQGSIDVIIQGTKAEGLTLGEACKRFATSELCPQIVGTPASVADQLQDLFEARACDGFILTSTVVPGT